MADLDRKRKLALAMQAQARARMRIRDQATETPDGRSVAPGTTTDEAARIPEGMVYDPQTGGYVDTALAAERMGPAQGANASFIAGAPLVGEWADEAMGQVDRAITGRNPEIATETMRQSREQFAEANPKTALGLEVGGGIVGSAPLAVAGAGYAMGAGGAVGTAARGLAVGAGAGAVEGAAAGAGANDENRAEGAAVGGAVGAGIGGAVGAAAPFVGRGAKALVRRVRKLDVKTIADEFGISQEAARSVRAALSNDDLQTAVSRLQQLGDDAMLADAGPSTGVMLDAASKTGGRALATTREAVEGRSAVVGRRLGQALDNVLGQPQGTRTAARGIAQRTAGTRRDAYNRAYGSPIDYSGKGRDIEAVLERVPPKTMQRAVDEANEAMREAGVRNGQIMAEIAEDGSVSFREMPNVQQLDELKRALDSIGREAVDNFGRPTAQGQRAQRLARDLRDTLSDAVPAYRHALKVGGDKIAEDQALDTGRRLLSRQTSVEDVRAMVGDGLSDEAGRAARQGLRENIEDTLSNVRRTITDPNTDAREAMQLVKDVSSRANKEKLSLILGDADAERLLSELDRTATALELRSMVSRNSDTAIRQAVQGQVKDEAAPGLLRRVLGRGGNPLDAARELTETIAGIDPASMTAREQGIFAEIADALVNTRGADARRALISVRRAMQGQPIKDREAELIGRAVAGGAFATLRQAGQQSLEPSGR